MKRRSRFTHIFSLACACAIAGFSITAKTARAQGTVAEQERIGSILNADRTKGFDQANLQFQAGSSRFERSFLTRAFTGSGNARTVSRQRFAVGPARVSSARVSSYNLSREAYAAGSYEAASRATREATRAVVTGRVETPTHRFADQSIATEAVRVPSELPFRGTRQDTLDRTTREAERQQLSVNDVRELLNRN
ncbi:MAG: hypothetical protein ACFCU3_00515 [Verrucomicrobiales bacterium]